MYKKHAGVPHIEEKEKKEEATKREKRELPRGSHLEEEEKKKNSQERVLRGEENRKESAKCCRF